MQSQRDRRLYRFKLAIGWITLGYLAGLLYAAVDRRWVDDSVPAIVALIVSMGVLAVALLLAMVRHHGGSQRDSHRDE